MQSCKTRNSGNDFWMLYSVEGTYLSLIINFTIQQGQYIYIYMDKDTWIDSVRQKYTFWSDLSKLPSKSV